MNKICKTCGKEKDMLSWEDNCYTCRSERYKQTLRDTLQSNEETETMCESDIHCPWCGEQYLIDDEYRLYEEGEHELTCTDCDKKFMASTEISYSFSTTRIEGGGGE